jgi:hypothetical protein
MNIFRVIASGKPSFREEFVSAFFAYLISPTMDHGLGTKFLTILTKQIGERIGNRDLQVLASEFSERLRDDFFNSENSQIEVDLEFAYTLTNKKGFVDIIVRYKDWYFLIENKILHTSKTDGQLQDQYVGVKARLEQQGEQQHRIVQIYLVPAILGQSGWMASQAFSEELQQVEYRKGDCGCIVYWQPPDDSNDLSIVGIIRNILQADMAGCISPLSYDIKQSLKSFIDFSLGEFSGYEYSKKTGASPIERLPVTRILEMDEDIYIGIQYGLGGLLEKAWRRPAFIKSGLLAVSDIPKGWQYLQLDIFKRFCLWAVNPDKTELSNMKWQGKPFGTVNLYRVAKTAGNSVYVGIRGGLAAFRKMSNEEILAKGMWEISSEKRSVSWFSGEDFCAVIEERKIQEVLEKYNDASTCDL